MREFDRDLLANLESWDLSLGNILDRGISFNDNLDVRSVTFTSSATPDAENTVSHSLGKIPTGYIVYSIDKGAVVYKGNTAWTSTNIYLKVNVASTTVKVWVF